MSQLFKIIDIFYTLRVFHKQIIAVSVFGTCSHKKNNMMKNKLFEKCPKPYH